VIAPPVRDLSRDEACRAAARRDAGIPIGVPLFVYPGDLEFSHGAHVVADAVPTLLSSVQDAWVVYACRAKTPGARAAQRAFQQAFRGQPRVHFVGEVADLPALLASAVAVLFPVDDLYGKVDLPYAVIEAALLGVPVIVDTNGPLADVQHAVAVGSRDPRAVAEASIRLARDDAARAQIGQAMRRAALVRHDPLRVMSAYEELYASLASGRPVA
jgi:phosphatidylinositol alpha-1,6-mannosyltransferase